MKRLFLTASLAAIICNFSYSQIDSIKIRLRNENQDTDRVKTLLSLSVSYLDSQPDSTLLFARQGLVVARKLKFIKAETDFLQIIGNAFIAESDYPRALENVLERKKIYEKTGNQIDIPAVLGDLGAIHNYEGEYEKALDFFLQAKKIIEKRHQINPSLIIYDKKVLITQYIGLGEVYEKQNKLDSAKIYAQKAYDLAFKTDNYGISTVLNNFGNLYSKMDSTIKAIRFYRSSLANFKQDEDGQGICESSLGLANLFRKLGQKDSCLFYAKLSAATAKKTHLLKYLFDASSFLLTYYKSLGNVDSSFFYQSICIDTKDSLFNREKTRQIQNLFYDEDIRQQKMAEENARLVNERKNSLQLLAITGFILLIGLVLILIRRRRAKASVIDIISTAALLIIFEFIALLIHPYIERVTNHRPIYMLLMLVLVASILIPLHHRIDVRLKEKKAFQMRSQKDKN